MSKKLVPINIYVLLVVALTAISFALRLYGLDAQSLWYDEIASWHQSRGSDLGEVYERMRQDIHPPGWNIILFYTQMLFGDSAYALRLPSLIGGTLVIPCVYLLGARISSKRTGIMAAATATVVWGMIYYSQESRAYALLTLGSALSTYLLVVLFDAIEDGENKIYRLAAGYIFVALISSYLHYSGVVMVAIQGGWALSRSLVLRKGIISCLVIYAIITFLYIPWILEVLQDLKIDKYWITSIANPAAVLNHFFVHNTHYVLYTGLISLIIAYGLLMELVDTRFDFKKILTSPILFFAVMLAAPYAAFFIKSVIGTKVLYPRYLLISAPFAYILLSHGINLILEKITQKDARASWLVTTMLFFGGLYYLVFVQKYYTTPQKTQYRELVNWAVNYDDVDLSKSTIIGYRGNLAFWYYLKRQNPPLHVSVRVPVNFYVSSDVKPEALEKLEHKLNESDNTNHWLFCGTGVCPNNLITYLKGRFDLVQHKQFKDANAFLFKNKELL